MKKQFSLIICLISVIILFNTFSLCEAVADDGGVGSDAQEFEVTQSTYDSVYKNNPDYELLKTTTYYRYATRTRSTTTSGYDSLNGWTKYDTKTSSSTSGYQFGTPISTSTSYADNKKTVKSAVDKGYYYYAYSVADPSKTSDWTYYVAKSRAAVISHMKENFSSSATWAEIRLRYFWYISPTDLGSTSGKLNKTIPYCADSTVSVGTLSQKGTHLYDLKMWKYKQVYKVKTDTTINYFYQWSAWSAWSAWSINKESLPSDSSKKEETETRYLVKLIKKAKPISECSSIVNSANTFEYNGEEKHIDITINDGDKVLVEGTDYVIDGNSGVDSGVYEVRINGIGDYTGEIVKSFEITKTAAVLDFANYNLTKNTQTDDFINELTVITDGQLSFSSSNENVATVGSNGMVSIVSKGKTVITVETTEGKNYKAGKASYELLVASNLYDCTVEIEGTTGFVYDGKDKHLSIIIFDGETKLTEGKDYEIEGNTGRNVGRYVVTISGIGDYVGQVKQTLNINKAAPVLSFESDAITKNTDDEDFINQLYAETDGTVSYTSSDNNVAQVDQNGKVTIISPGSVAITAIAADGNNYKQGKSSYSLTIVEASKIPQLDELSYSFKNDRNGYGYKSNDIIPASIYRMIFGQVVGNTLYAQNKKKTWGGNCAGASATAALLFDKQNDIHPMTFNSLAKVNKDLGIKDKTQDELVLLSFIEAMQVSQNASLFQQIDQRYMVSDYDLNRKTKNLNNIFNTVKNQTEAGIPVMMTLRCSGVGGHAILAYAVEDNSNNGKIYVYDSNHPLENCAIEMVKDNDNDWIEWSYDMGSYGVWGNKTDSEVCYLGLVPYGIIKTIWEGRGELQKNYNLLSTNAKDVAIYDVEDNLLANIQDGDLVNGKKDIIIHSEDLSIGGSDEDNIMITLPIDVYTIKNKDKAVDDFQIELLNSDVGSNITTSANQLTLVADDENDLNQVFIEAGKDDYYDVTLNSTISGDNNEVVVKGNGSDDTLSISQFNGEVNVENCQVLSMTVDNAAVESEVIRARAYGRGSISPAGTTKVVKGTDRVYTIEPEAGYEIQDVIVDDVSVGAVDSYKFKNVNESHEIFAIFEAASAFKKIDNIIYAKDITKTSSPKSQAFNLNVITEGKAKILYQSNNDKIQVSDDGKVTIDENYVGTAKITIIAAANDLFNQADKTITVTVKPAVVKSFKAKAKKGRKAVISWNRLEGFDGYQVQYSFTKNFKKVKTKNLKGAKKSKATIKNLKKNKTYYLRIRAYKKNYDGILYSEWSGIKKIKIKK